MKVLEFIYKYLTLIKEWILKFFHNSFSVTTSKRSKIIGFIIVAVTLAAVIVFVISFTTQEFSD